MKIHHAKRKLLTLLSKLGLVSATDVSVLYTILRMQTNEIRDVITKLPES